MDDEDCLLGLRYAILLTKKVNEMHLTVVCELHWNEVFYDLHELSLCVATDQLLLSQVVFDMFVMMSLAGIFI